MEYLARIHPSVPRRKDQRHGLRIKQQGTGSFGRSRRMAPGTHNAGLRCHKLEDAQLKRRSNDRLQPIRPAEGHAILRLIRVQERRVSRLLPPDVIRQLRPLLEREAIRIVTLGR